jgi:phytoene dehydrogenase-like protein
MHEYDAIVIGACHSGLALGAHLARNGPELLMFEFVLSDEEGGIQ